MQPRGQPTHNKRRQEQQAPQNRGNHQKCTTTVFHCCGPVIKLSRHQNRVLQVLLDFRKLRGVVVGQSCSRGFLDDFDDFRATFPSAVSRWLEQVQAEVRLTVHRVHARFYLRMDPQSGPLLHRAQEERFEVQEHFVVTFSIPRRLVGDYGGEVPVSATRVIVSLIFF